MKKFCAVKGKGHSFDLIAKDFNRRIDLCSGEVVKAQDAKSKERNHRRRKESQAYDLVPHPKAVQKCLSPLCDGRG